MDFKIPIFIILGIPLVLVGIEQQVFGLEPQFVPCLSVTPGQVCRDVVFTEPPVNEGDSRFSWFNTAVDRFRESHLACYISTLGISFSCSPETIPPTLADTSNRIVGYNAVRPGVGCVLDLPTWMTRGSNPVDFTIPWSGGQNIALRDIDVDAGQKGAVNNAIIGTIYHPLGLIDDSKLTTRELALDPATLRDVTGGTESQKITKKQFLAFDLAADYGPSAWKDYIPVNHVRTLIWWGHSSVTSGVSEKWDFHETHGLVHVIDQVPPVITSNNLVVKSDSPDGILTNQINYGVTAADQCGGNTLVNNAPSFLPIGVTTVKWTSTDDNGNVITKNQMITVEFADEDGDGIADVIDTLPTQFSDDFDDATDAPNTEGTIEERGDQVLGIGQTPVPEGVFFNADEGGGETPATIIACEKAGQIKVDSGDSGNITCGSIRVSIVTGSVDVQFFTKVGPATVTMGALDSLTFDADTLKFINNSLSPVEIKIRGITISLSPGETKTVTFPSSSTSYQDPNLGDVRHGQGHDNGFCMNENCINVDGFFNHFPETIVPQGSTQTFSLLINCPRGTNTCNHASIEGVLPDSDFYEEQWGVTLDRLPRSNTWETVVDNPYGEIGEVTTTVQEVDQSFLSVSFNIEFLIPGSVGTVDGLRVAHENNRHLHVTVWDSNRGLSNYIFNEGVYVDDIYAYPKVETSYEKAIEIEKLCLNENPNKRYTCAFDKVREWTIKNAEKALLEIKGITELEVLSEEFLLKFKELKQAIADDNSEKISDLRMQLDELGTKIHNMKQ